MMIRTNPFQSLSQNVNHLERRRSEALKIDENEEPKKSVSIVPTIQKEVEKENIDPCENISIDYDQQQSHVLESVSDFAMDIFTYYKSRENTFRVDQYLGKHPDLCAKSRAILIDWLVELQETFEMNHETLYNAVKLIDLYLSKTENFKKDDFQKLACAALFLAAKFDERRPPLIDDLAYLSGDRFDRQQFLEMERNLFETVGFDLGAPLSYRYLRRLARVSGTDLCDLTLARYILETTLLIYDFSLFSSCKVAAACFVLGMKMKNKDFVWDETLVKYSGYTYDEIQPLVPLVNHSLHVINNSWSQLKNIRNKYSNQIFFSVALIPLLPDNLSEAKIPLPLVPFL